MQDPLYEDMKSLSSAPVPGDMKQKILAGTSNRRKRSVSLKKNQSQYLMIWLATAVAVLFALKPMKIQSLHEEPYSNYFSSRPDQITEKHENFFMNEGFEVTVLPWLNSFEPSAIRCFAFSPDGKTLVSSSSNIIRLWDIASGRELRTFSGSENYTDIFAFSADGKTLITGSDCFVIKVWDVKSGSELKILPFPKWDISSLCVSQKTKTIVSGHHEGTIRLWDIESCKELRAFSGSKGGKRIDIVTFSPDGKILASTSRGEGLKLWDVENGKVLRDFPGGINSHFESPVFSHNGKMLAWGHNDMDDRDKDKKMILWDLENNKELKIFPTSACIIKFAPNDESLLTGGGRGDKTLEIWDLETGKCLASIQNRVISAESIRSMAVSKDGVIACGNHNGTITLYRKRK